jgi:hypothetical protein
MSALGQKQTFGWIAGMSGLPPKADIVQHGGNVRFVPIADIARERAPVPRGAGTGRKSGSRSPSNLASIDQLGLTTVVRQQERPRGV